MLKNTAVRYPAEKMGKQPDETRLMVELVERAEAGGTGHETSRQKLASGWYPKTKTAAAVEGGWYESI